MIDGKVAQRLGHRDRVAIGERQRGGALQHRGQLVPSQFVGGAPRQRHLQHLEFAVGGAEAAPQRLLLGHGKAAVLGDERRFGVLQPLPDLLNGADLLWSWHPFLHMIEGPRRVDPGPCGGSTCAGRGADSPIEPGGHRRSRAEVWSWRGE